MKITREQADKINIPIAEIEKDLADTVTEATVFESLLEVWMKNPVENKLDIYMTEGKLAQRRDFIRKLNCILDLKNDPELLEAEYK